VHRYHLPKDRPVGQLAPELEAAFAVLQADGGEGDLLGQELLEHLPRSRYVPLEQFLESPQLILDLPLFRLRLIARRLSRAP